MRQRTGSCQDCGETITAGMRGQFPLRCDECKAIKKKADRARPARPSTSTCEGCGAAFPSNPVGRPWTRCDDCVSTKIAAQRSRRAAAPPPNSIPCDDCGKPVSQTRPIEGVDTVCAACSGLGCTARRFPCSGCGVRFVRRHRGGPSSKSATVWLCDRCESHSKWCSGCKQVKSLEKFAQQRERRTGRMSRCKECNAAVYAKADKPALMARQRKRIVLKREDIFKRYGRRCSICGATKSNTANRTGLAIDHDHSCCPGATPCVKCIRGILCLQCNVGLGNFGDDIKRLQAAITYLTQYH